MPGSRSGGRVRPKYWKWITTKVNDVANAATVRTTRVLQRIPGHEAAKTDGRPGLPEHDDPQADTDAPPIPF